MTSAVFPLNLKSCLNYFSVKTFKRDLMGGLTAAIVSLPLGLAFGVASGAGPEAGLYGAILVGLFASIFGGTPTLISEPTGPMTVVMTAVIATLIGNNPENGMAMAFTVVMLAGCFQILLGSLKLGRYITIMPYSVISGFMSGIGVILIVLQTPNFLGVEGQFSSVANTLLTIPGVIAKASIHELLLGSAALAILFLSPKKITKAVPPQLIALVLCTLASLLFFSQDDFRRIDEISLGLPTLHFPTFSISEIQFMLVNGMVLGALGCIDSLLTSVIADSLTRSEHKSDKELIGQGIGNLVSGVFGGLPGAGATMGTVVNIQTGARSAFSGVSRSIILLVILIGAAGLVQYIPMAVLAAITIKVGLNILDWSFVKRAHQISVSATCIMYIVLALTVLVDLMVAVGVGMFIANLMTIDRLSELQEKNIRLISDADDNVQLKVAERNLLNEARKYTNTLLVYISGPMIFGVAKALRREAGAVGNANTLILDLSDIHFLDTTMALAIENMVVDALEKDKDVFLVHDESGKRGRGSYQGLMDSLMSFEKVVSVSSRKEALEMILRMYKLPVETGL